MKPEKSRFGLLSDTVHEKRELMLCLSILKKTRETSWGGPRDQVGELHAEREVESLLRLTEMVVEVSPRCM